MVISCCGAFDFRPSISKSHAEFQSRKSPDCLRSAKFANHKHQEQKRLCFCLADCHIHSYCLILHGFLRSVIKRYVSMKKIFVYSSLILILHLFCAPCQDVDLACGYRRIIVWAEMRNGLLYLPSIVKMKKRSYQ